MEAPENAGSLVAEFSGITGASALVSEHYLSACNYDLNRAVEFFFEHPPGEGLGAAGNLGDDDGAAGDAPGRPQDEDFGAGPQELGGMPERGPGAVAFAAGGGGEDNEDEELQRALAESLGQPAPPPRPRPHGPHPAGAHARPPGPVPRVQVLDEVPHLEDDDEELPDADAELRDMAARHEAFRASEQAARANMEEMMERMIGAAGLPLPPGFRAAGTVNPPMGYPSIFPGLFPGQVGGARRPGGSRGGSGRMAIDDEDDDDLMAGGSGRGGRAAVRPGAEADEDEDLAGLVDGDDLAAARQQQQRRRLEVRRGGGGRGGGGSGGGEGGGGAAGGRQQEEWDHGLELPEGMSRHELEEARMMEAALLGVPYEGRIPDYSNRTAGGMAGGAYGGMSGEPADVAPEVLEHRELRWDQDRAYEESLAADRAKAEAAARVKREAEENERAEREAAEAAARAAADEAARLAALVGAKAARLPAEPHASSPDAVMVMVRLPDGSRHSRRFARSNKLSSLFDFVDVELDAAAKEAAAAGGSGSEPAPGSGEAAGSGGSAALKPGSYNLVAQFPRRVFSEDENGDKSFEEAGLASGGGAAFFIEQR